MGTVNARGGKLYLDFRYRNRRVREYFKLEDTPANRKRLKTVMDRIDSSITLGIFRYEDFFEHSKNAAKFKEHDERIEQLQASTPIFREFSGTWFSENEIGWKHSYKITLRTSLDKHVLPAFGEQPVGHITRADILAFRANLGKIPRKDGSVGLSAARINTVLVPLRLILREAADRFAFESPYKNIKALRVPKTQIQPFTLDEVQLILENVRPAWRPYLETRFYSGIRSGELAGLKWKYVDFTRRVIQIRESLVAGELTDTKTDSSCRDIPMSQFLVDALKEQEKRTKGREYVFCNGEGNPLSIQNVTNRVWAPLLRYLGLPYRKIYQTRHTAASLWLAAGENVMWVSKVLGHADIHTTLTRYAAYTRDLTHRDGSAFEALLAAKMGNQHQDDQKGEDA